MRFIDTVNELNNFKEKKIKSNIYNFKLKS